MILETRKLISKFVFLLLPFAALGACPPQTQPQFEILDIGTLESDESAAYSINDEGQVVGTYKFHGNSYSFLWDAQKGLSLLDLPSCASPLKINNLGQIIGNYCTPDNKTRGFFWDPKSGLLDIGTLGGSNTLVADINDLGQVVGQSDRITGQTFERHAFLWEKGVMKDLGAVSGDLGLPGDTSFAKAINNQGEIVGVACYPLVHKGKIASREYRAVVWKNGEIRQIMPIAKGYNEGMAANNSSRYLVFSNESLYAMDIKSGLIGKPIGSMKPSNVVINDKKAILFDRYIVLQDDLSSLPKWIELKTTIDKPGSIWRSLDHCYDMNNCNWVVGVATNIYNEKHAVLIRPINNK